MVSQAEHDPAAASVLITDSTALADAVEGRMSERAARTKHSKRVREALGGPQSGIVIVDTVGAAIDVANAYGPEHLEIHTRHVNRDAKRIRNAGAIFVGPYTPVPLGDYLAGSNHVLPTGGTARFASGLNVHSFLKAVQEIEYTKEAAAACTSLCAGCPRTRTCRPTRRLSRRASTDVRAPPGPGGSVQCAIIRRAHSRAGAENAVDTRTLKG